MVHESVVSCIGRTPLVALRRLFPRTDVDIIAKLEMLNPGGSVKDRPARFIIEEGLREGAIRADTHLIESSSGNLGIALAMVARVYGLAFTCVVDPNIVPANLQILQRLDARVEMVHEPDDHRGYLKTRIQRVQSLLASTPHGLWVNQYANQRNWQSHFFATGDEILADLDGPIDCFVAAVSTTGTIHGISRRLRQAFPKLQVIAVDAEGSILFGGPPKPRHVPGIGSSRVPELMCPQEIDRVVYVGDTDAVRGCRDLAAREGIFAGGSSGSVVAALGRLLPSFPPGYRVLTLFADRGDRYLDTVYDDDWVEWLRQPTIEALAAPVLAPSLETTPQ